jgi:hypothetical protein
MPARRCCPTGWRPCGETRSVKLGLARGAAGAGPRRLLARLRHDPASAVSRRRGPASRCAIWRASGTAKRSAREGGGEMSFLRSGSSGPGRLADYGRLAPVRPPAGGYGGARPGGPGGPGGPALGRRSLLGRALAKDSVLRHMDWVLIVAVLALTPMASSVTTAKVARRSPWKPAQDRARAPRRLAHDRAADSALRLGASRDNPRPRAGKWCGCLPSAHQSAVERTNK